jgi:hypothetical protein
MAVHTREDSRPLLDSGNEGDMEEEEEEKAVPTPRTKEKAADDPVLGAIGEFGPYQAWLCCVGFLMNVVHAWLSLSLKFVGWRTEFWCAAGGADGGGAGREQCHVYDKNNSSTACTSWRYDHSQFRGTIVER